MTKVNKACYSEVKDWSEYDYLFELITVEKNNPYHQGYHPLEENYPLLKLIATSGIYEENLRRNLVDLLEEGVIE
jgi:hypothetical protein